VYKAIKASGESVVCSVISTLCPIGLSLVRGNIRKKKVIAGSMLTDLASVHFCYCCSAIQMKREFNNGYDYDYKTT